MRIDSPNPDIEMIETDVSSSPDGKFELAVSGGQFQINARNADNNSFTSMLLVDNIKNGSGFFPNSNAQQDLGKPTNAWRSIYAQDVNASGNYLGQVAGFIAQTGMSCTSICNAASLVAAGTHWSCVGAFTGAGNPSTCAAALEQRNCICRLG
jgi:hypothetical protein